MLENLFEDTSNISFIDKVNNFEQASKKYRNNDLQTYWDKNASMSQTPNCVSLYLWFKYPDKCYLYKQEACNAVSQFLFQKNFGKAKEGEWGEALERCNHLYTELEEKLKNYEQKLTDVFEKFNDINLFKGNKAIQLKMIAQDFGWFIKQCSEKEGTTSLDDGDNTMIADLQKQKNLLLSKKNVILQGAPGTGKTYSTAALALSIIGADIDACTEHDEVMAKYNELVDEGQIRFVTFHQSMDYEDFIEGYKPEKTESGLSYDLVSGVFKTICTDAKTNYENSLKNIDVLNKDELRAENIDCFLEEAIGQHIEFETSNKNKFTIEELTKNNSLKVSIPENEKIKILSVPFDEIQELVEKDVKLSQVKDVRGYFKRQWPSQSDSYVYALCQALRDKIKDSGLSSNVKIDEKIPLKNYVLVIDEINRGNVSKIFGELITLLEADKRMGGAHSIKLILPYSKKPMEIPPNLYIIGTMNTTDRSVGSIDYAVRRRFSFITLESKKEVLEAKGSSEKALSLFDAVKSFIEKNKVELDMKDLMIGHSYFLDGNDVTNLSIKWEYDIRPLLSEYYKDGLLKEDVPVNENGSYMGVDEFIDSQKDVPEVQLQSLQQPN